MADMLSNTQWYINLFQRSFTELMPDIMRKESAGRNNEDCTTAQQNICIQSWQAIESVWNTRLRENHLLADTEKNETSATQNICIHNPGRLLKVSGKRDHEKQICWPKQRRLYTAQQNICIQSWQTIESVWNTRS